MAISRFFDQDIIVRRLSATEGNKIAYQAVATVEGHIQGLDDQARQALGIIEEKAWKAWFDVDADLTENDTLVGDDDKEYNVREIVIKDYGVNQHQEVILIEQLPEE